MGKSVQHFVSILVQRSNIEVTFFFKAFFLDLLKCIYCQITVSVYTIPYCLPVRFLVCSQVLFAFFFPLFWQTLLVMHYYRACVALVLGKSGYVPFCASVFLSDLCFRGASSTLDIQGLHLGESSLSL